MPTSEDTVDGWTASTTGSVRKGFELGMDSSTASVSEVKVPEWAEEEERKVRKTGKNIVIMVERTVRRVKKMS